MKRARKHQTCVQQLCLEVDRGDHLVFWEGKKGGKFHIVHLYDAAALQDLGFVVFAAAVDKNNPENLT